MVPSFDLISDLYLTEEDHFDWEGKPTSLYCIVAGNISEDLGILRQTLMHLSTHYLGVFYIDGSLEHPTLRNYPINTKRIENLISSIPNVVYLHNNVVILDGIALIAVNGWWANCETPDDLENTTRLELMRLDDAEYLRRTIDTMQVHPDVEDIIVISNCLPGEALLFGNTKFVDIPADESPNTCLYVDREKKSRYWLFGSHPVSTDVIFDGVQYHSNAKYRTEPYWPKRIAIRPRTLP